MKMKQKLRDNETAKFHERPVNQVTICLDLDCF